MIKHGKDENGSYYKFGRTGKKYRYKPSRTGRANITAYKKACKQGTAILMSMLKKKSKKKK